MNYFYVLKSLKDEKYYYGSTSDLKRRFIEHTKGKVSATQFRRPFKIIYYEAYEHIYQARLREKQVKLSGSIRKQLCDRLSKTHVDERPARPPYGKPGQ